MLIVQTPLRVSIAGGGTDLPAYYKRGKGAVVSTAIDKYVYVTVHRRFDERIVIGYMKKEVVDHVDDIQHELVREAMRLTGVGNGVEINIMADIPSEGSGLGSSSSLTVGLLNALHQFRGVQASPAQLAEEACEIEIKRCGRPIGKQDQYIAAYGGLRYFEFHPDETVTVEDLTVGKARQELSARLLLFFTNVTRQASSILQEQSDRSGENRSHLDGIRDLASRVRDAIRVGAYDEIGRALEENWKLKKELASGISNPSIAEMIDKARKGGALGSKISGAGGGGFMLTYCPHQLQDALRKNLSSYREMPFFLERYGSKVIFHMESYEWK